VDLRGLQAEGAGPMWTAATSVAAVQAVLESGVDPRIGQLQYSLPEESDGPSAGALTTVGSLAEILLIDARQ
jgi:predicted S18 family serine protease